MREKERKREREGREKKGEGEERSTELRSTEFSGYDIIEKLTKTFLKAGSSGKKNK